MCHLDHHRKFPTKIIWTRDLDSDIAGSSKDTQRIEPKPIIPNYQVQGDLLQNEVKKPWNVPSLIATLLIKRNMLRSQIQRVRGRPVCGSRIHKTLACWHLNMLKNDQTGTGKPVTVDQKEKHKIDFRVPGLSHSVVTEAEHLRVQELLKRIETHPHRAALHADLKQNNVYILFSKNSKEMIRELGNVELCRVVRNYTKSTMSSLSSFLESRNCVLHLRTMIDLQRIQKKVWQIKTGCNLYPELRDKEKSYTWCSTRQDRGTRRIPPGLECVEEML